MANLQNFTSETQLTTSEQTLTSTASSEIKFIGKFTLTNTSTENVEVTIWRIDSSTSGTDGVGGNYIWQLPVSAGRTITVDKLQGHVLGNLMKISAKAAVDNVINVDISGTLEN